jgi:hypothetical protein
MIATITAITTKAAITIIVIIIIRTTTRIKIITSKATMANNKDNRKLIN